MRFGYTILYVPDVAAAVAFYERAFGLRRRLVHDSGYAELDSGPTTLAFASHDLARGNGTRFATELPPGHSPPMEVAFVTDDVAAAFRKAVGAGAAPVAEPRQKPWGQTVSYLRDANGFLVELCSPVSPPAAGYTVRPVEPADTDALVALAVGSGLFKPEEREAVRGVFDAYHAGNREAGGRALACDEGGAPVGVAYFVPKEMTDRTWELLMIAVDDSRQGRGVGTRLLQAVEDAARAENGRLLLVETSSRPGFEPARRFYRRHGYAEVAHIPDAFADGDGKVVFTKRLAAGPDHRLA